tara:strand:+ start:2556 stop:3197 length:642 start_codon:yes stop_codon:yes gene_type:complete
MGANEYNQAKLDADFIKAGHITEMTKLWQEHKDMELVDGKFGKDTANTFEKKEETTKWRKDSGRAWAERKYGNFKFKSLPNGRIKISPKWVKDNIVAIKLHTGKTVRLHKDIADDFVVTFKKACESSGYIPSSVQTFVKRHTMWNPERSLSAHSWGVAVDFDPPKNPMGGKIKSTGKPSKLRGHMEFVKAFKDDGWTWGGDWRMKDDMHFEKR